MGWAKKMMDYFWLYHLYDKLKYSIFAKEIKLFRSEKKGDYIRQYPNSIGMFKKIIVDKAINQVSVRYNINVNKESSRHGA